MTLPPPSQVKHFLGDSCVHFNRRVSKIDNQGDVWEVTDSEGLTEQFDAVLLTCPIEQVLQLSGNVTSYLEGDSELYQKLKHVQYSKRWAIGFHYSSGPSSL